MTFKVQELHTSPTCFVREHELAQSLVPERQVPTRRWVDEERRAVLYTIDTRGGEGYESADWLLFVNSHLMNFSTSWPSSGGGTFQHYFKAVSIPKHFSDMKEFTEALVSDALYAHGITIASEFWGKLDFVPEIKFSVSFTGTSWEGA